MRKSLFSVVCFFLVLLTLTVSCQQRTVGFFPQFPPQGEYLGDELGFSGGGAGTSYDPIRIRTADDFTRFLSLLDDEGTEYASLSFALEDDVVLSAPVNPVAAFSGTLDGNGHSISGLRIDTPAVIGDPGDEDYCKALFAELKGAEIRNLDFEDVDISFPEGTTGTNYFSSVVAGVISDGTVIDNVNVNSGTVSSPARAGGLVARVKGGSSAEPNIISNSSNAASVSSAIAGNDEGKTYGTAGGIVSNLAKGSFSEIENCHNTGDIEGYCSGGIVGDIQSEDSLISSSSNNGHVRGTVFAGGIVADYWYGGAGTIKDCHNLSASVIESYKSYYPANDGMYGDVNIGGIAGVTGLGDKVTISDCTNEGTLRNNADDILVSIGGIVGTASQTEIIDSQSSGHIENNASPYTDDRGRIRNRWTTGGVIGWGKGAELTIQDSYGNDDADLYDGFVYGEIAGSINTQGGSGTNRIVFESIHETARPFGYIHNSSDSGEPVFEIKGLKAEKLYHALNRGEMIFDLDGSEIENMCLVNYLDDGDSSFGTVAINGGDIGTLVVYADATEDSGYPSFGEWEMKYILTGIDAVDWNIVPFENLASSVAVTINGEKCGSATGTWTAEVAP